MQTKIKDQVTFKKKFVDATIKASILGNVFEKKYVAWFLNIVNITGLVT